MAEPKTRPTKESVAKFIAAIENETRRTDAKAVDKIMRDVTGKKPVMWGAAIVGYDSYDSRTGDWPIAAFSPRKTSLVIYVPGLQGYGTLLKKIGKHEAKGGCLHIKSIANIDESVLRELLARSVKAMRDEHAPS